ncbi:Tetraspanin-10 [Capsicum annuum]|nr:Tetraspanin-10 [Capsicum annuum]
MQLLAVGVVGFGIWMGAHHDGCRKSLTLPVLGLGVSDHALLDFGGNIGLHRFGDQNESAAAEEFAEEAALFIVTNNSSGHSVNGLRYKEYHLQDYSSWFLKQTRKEYKLAKLTPIEAGCCRPPSECGYPAVNASYYDLSFHPKSSSKDCKLYKNSKNVKCYSCDSCKAGVAQYMKTEWRVVAIFNVILFIVLSIIYFVGCCARRSAARRRSKI